MSLVIREYAGAGPAADADAKAVAELLREAAPHLVVTAAVVRAQAEGSPARQRYRLLIAEEDGRPVGCARAGLFADTSDPGIGFANLTVRAAARGRGTGSALLAAAEAHLAGIGATTCYAWVADEPPAHAFARRGGYRRGRPATFARLDLGGHGPLPARPAVAQGVRLLPAAHWADDPGPLYEVDLEAIQDEPGDVASDSISYQDWLTTTWDRPDFDAGLSTVAVVDGQVAAFVIAQTDGGERYWSGGTGTRRAFRGAGLAKAAKTHSLHLARARGLRAACTSNDNGNAPMLAVNRWLGYQPCGTEWRYVRDLTDRA